MSTAGATHFDCRMATIKLHKSGNIGWKSSNKFVMAYFKAKQSACSEREREKEDFHLRHFWICMSQFDSMNWKTIVYFVCKKRKLKLETHLDDVRIVDPERCNVFEYRHCLLHNE